MLFLFCVALWFILWALHVLKSSRVLCPRVSSFLLALWSSRLGKRELVCVLLGICLFVLCVLVFVIFLFLLVSGVGCGLYLWHSLDFSINRFVKLHESTVADFVHAFWKHFRKEITYFEHAFKVTNMCSQTRKFDIVTLTDVHGKLLNVADYNGYHGNIFESLSRCRFAIASFMFTRGLSSVGFMVSQIILEQALRCEWQYL